MEKAFAEVMNNDNQTTALPRREVIKVADFEKISVSDMNNMFGTWKETDHCDKDRNLKD